MYLLSEPARLLEYLHCSQLKGFSALWINKCCLRFLAFMVEKPQVLQVWDFFPLDIVAIWIKLSSFISQQSWGTLRLSISKIMVLVWKSEIICSIRNSPFLAKLSLQDMNMLSNTLSMFGLVVPYQCSLNHKINHANLIFWNLPPMLSPSIYFTCCQVPNSTLLYWPSTCSTNHHHYIANS